MSQTIQSVRMARAAGLLAVICGAWLSPAAGQAPASVVDRALLNKIRVTAASDPNSLMLQGDRFDRAATSFMQRRIAEASTVGLSAAALDQVSQPWLMFESALTAQIAPGRTELPGLQIPGIPTPADWAEPNLGPYNTWAFCDMLPPWGPNYLPSNARLSDGYKLFLNNLELPQPNEADHRRAQEALDKLVKASNRLQSVLGAVGNDWRDFDRRQQGADPAARLTYQQWYDRVEKAQVDRAQSDVDYWKRVAKTFAQRSGQGFALAADAIDAFGTTTAFRTALSPAGDSIPMRPCDIRPSLSTFIAEGKNNVTQNAPSAFTITMNSNSGTSHEENTAWGARASWFGFFGAGANGSRHELDTHSNEFQLTFTARHFRLFTVRIRDWFNPTAVTAYGNGPFVGDGELGRGIVHLFHDAGILRLAPAAVAVAYRPTVAIRLSAANYQEIKTAINAGGGFSIGPFGFGASYHKDTRDIKFDDATHTVTATDNTDTPQIMAVVYDVLGPADSPLAARLRQMALPVAVQPNEPRQSSRNRNTP